jgi:hypothetical protein
MAKFEVGEVAELVYTDPLVSKDLLGLECTILEISPPGGDYRIDIHGVSPLTYGANCFVCYEYSLGKKKPPQESKDIQETRQKGAPRFHDMLSELNREKVQ